MPATDLTFPHPLLGSTLLPVKFDLPSLRMRRKWLTLLILPALLFRALIPVGFMPMVDFGGRLTIGFCPGEGGMLTAIERGTGHAAHSAPANISDNGDQAHAGHEHHHHHGGGAPDSASQHHTPCLFAASACGAPPPTAVALCTPSLDAAHIAVSDVDTVFLPTIIRTQTSRGPPVLS